MNLTRLNLIAVLALGGWMAGTTASQAQTSNAAPTAPAAAGTNGLARPMRRSGGETYLGHLKTLLSLTDAQMPKVKAVLDNVTKQRGELQQASPDERRQKYAAIIAEQDKQMKEILTPEQYEKWKSSRAPQVRRTPGVPPAASAPADKSGANDATK